MLMAAEKTGKKRPGGRPTKYKPEYVVQVYKLCLLGATNEQLADFFEVNPDTIYEWMKVHREFSEALKKGKLEADAKVAESLFKRACGYEHPETKVFCSNGEITEHTITRYYPPDTTACIFWLKNRQPHAWREQQHLTIHESPAPLSDDEVMERIAELEAAGTGLAIE